MSIPEYQSSRQLSRTVTCDAVRSGLESACGAQVGTSAGRRRVRDPWTLWRPTFFAGGAAPACA